MKDNDPDYILNEAIIQPEEVLTYGANIADYDDMKIGYHGVSRSYFIVTKISEDEYLSVAVSRVDGLIRFTLVQNAYVGRMIHLRALYRNQLLRKSLPHLGKVLYLLGIILRRFHMRIPNLRIIAPFRMMDRVVGYLVRSPAFRTMLRRLRFRTFNRRVVKNEKEEYVVYSFKKDTEESSR